MEAEALHVLGGIAQEEAHLVREVPLIQTAAESLQHGLQAALRRVALPQEQCPHRRVVQLPLQPLRPVDQQQAPGTAGPDYPQLDAPPGQLMLILTEEGRGAGLRAAPGDQVGGLDARHGRSPVVGQGALQIQLSVVHGRPPSWLAETNEYEKKKRAAPLRKLA